MKIEEVMNQEIISVKKDSNPIEAFEIMFTAGVRRIFVVDENNNTVGVIAHSDLIEVLNGLENKPKTKITAEDIMTKEIVTIESKYSVKSAANLMLRADVSGLLVVEDQEPVGVFTKTDICRLVAANLLVANKE